MGDVEGFLLKQGVGPLLGKRYKRRWFKLIGTQMHYYKARLDTDSIGYIDLTTASGVQKNDDYNDGKEHFQIDTPGRAWQLIAENAEDVQRWMYAINNVINPNRKESGIPRVPSVMSGPIVDAAKTIPQQSSPVVQRPKPPVAAPAPAGAASFTLATVQRHAEFLQQQNQVSEFWQMYSQSVNELPNSKENDYQCIIAADMEKITWRTLGQQSRCIQPMVDFFWSVGAPELELDRLNSVGTLINPSVVGYWITVSSKLGIDGGWYFPAQVGTEVMEASVDESKYRDTLCAWLAEHGIRIVQTVSRDMGAQPPRQSEISIDLPGATCAEQLAVAESAFETFGFPALPVDVVEYIKAYRNNHLKLFINVTFEGFVKTSILLPYPPAKDLGRFYQLAGLHESRQSSLKTLEAAVGVTPTYVEFIYLKEGFGYGVYKEGFDVAFHLHSNVADNGWLKLGCVLPEYLHLLPQTVRSEVDAVLGDHAQPGSAVPPDVLEKCTEVLLEHQRRAHPQ